MGPLRRKLKQNSAVHTVLYAILLSSMVVYCPLVNRARIVGKVQIRPIADCDGKCASKSVVGCALIGIEVLSSMADISL